MTRLPSLALVGALLASSACASTVQLRSQQQLGGSGVDQGQVGGQTDGSGATADSSGGAPGGTSGALAPGSTGSTAAGGSATSGGSLGPASAAGSSGSAAAGAGPSAGGIPVKGPGWDAKYVYVGALTVNDLHTVAGGLGINLDPGDLEADANAVAKYVNDHGGLLGRQVKMLFRDTKTADVAADPVRVGQAVCADFTQDRRIIALYNPVTTLDTDNLRRCFAKAGTPIFSPSSAITDSTATKGLEGFFYQTAMVAWDKLAPVFVNRLKAQGYMSGWDARLGQPSSKKPVFGIVTSTTPAGTRVAAQIKGALASAGYPGALVYQWSDASQGQNNSVTYMNGNNVDHVIVADLELTAFQNSAQNQQYKPRYGITSYNDPYTNLETLSPKGANNGAVGIGWAPAYDVSDQNDPGSTGKGEDTCLKLMAAGGQTFSGKRTAKLFALAACDSILLAVEGARSQKGLDARSIYAGALRISPTFSTAVSFGTSALTPTHLFTPSSARDLAWVSACSCFKYQSSRATARF
ncbi:MAG: hypothetical protein JWO12_354 [Frankiales bacterium]|nr:hypothetical protein [Frankiales bacterium]